MADNTKQFNWIVKIKVGLEVLFADRADVFVAGDLLWYPFEGDSKTRIAPDALVAFGRPKGDRGSYRQWEEGGIAPQAVFEVLSPGNTKKEMAKKRDDYEKYGVEEYYEYDPDRNILKGWLRSGKMLVPIENMRGWVSPLLGIRFEPGEDDLDIFRPDGRKFLSPVETEREKTRLEEEKQQVEKEKKQAEKEKKQAEKEKKQAEKEKKQAEIKAEKERKRAEDAEARAEMLAAKLKELGISVTG